MRFMMIMIPDVYRNPVPPDFKPDLEAVRKMGEYNEQLRKAGVLLALDGLTPPSADRPVIEIGAECRRANHLERGGRAQQPGHLDGENLDTLSIAHAFRADIA